MNNILRPIINNKIEGHKEYQLKNLEKYNSNKLNFNKKRVTNKMIEEYTKYFVDDNTFMAVKPSNNNCYPSGYYEHVRKNKLFVDQDNKIILCITNK